MTHPWRRLRSLAHVTLLWHDDGPAGLTDFAEQTISIRRGMTYAERRTTVLHECLHIERGPTVTTLSDREELRVEKETARLLMPCIRQVGEALAWAHDLSEAADELAVDDRALWTRIRYAHPAEKAYLKARLEDH